MGDGGLYRDSVVSLPVSTLSHRVVVVRVTQCESATSEQKYRSSSSVLHNRIGKHLTGCLGSVVRQATLVQVGKAFEMEMTNLGLYSVATMIGVSTSLSFDCTYDSHTICQPSTVNVVHISDSLSSLSERYSERTTAIVPRAIFDTF